MLLVFAVGALVPAPASAAPYVIRQCNDGSGGGVPIAPDFMTVWENRPVTNSCASNGSVSFQLTPNALAPYSAQGTRMMGFSFELPSSVPNTRFTKAYATLWVPPAVSDPNLSDMQVALHSEGGGIVETDRLSRFSSWGGLPNVARGGDVPTVSKFVRFLVYCWAPCDFQGSPSMAMSNVVLTIDDPVAPNAPTFEPSGLLDGKTQSGTKVLRYAASDADSGIKRIELRTAGGGIQLANTPENEGCSYTRPAPCPQQRLQEQFTLDTTRLPDGRHTLELWVTDAAGLQTKTPLPPITVQNSPTPTPTPTPTPIVVPTPVPIAVGSTPTPAPIVAGSTPKPTPTPSPLPGSTPFSESSDTPETPAAPPATAQTAVSFTVSRKSPRRGDRVTFSGSVTPAPAVAGRLIIEAKAGKKWITAAVVRTRAAGAFTWSHAFSRRGTYTMRARLLTSVEAKTPPAVSPKRTFRVR